MFFFSLLMIKIQVRKHLAWKFNVCYVLTSTHLVTNTTCIRNPAGQWTSAIAEMVLVDSPVLILVPSTTWKLENEDKAFRNQAGLSEMKENSYQLEFFLISSMKRPAELQIHNSELKTWAAPCCLLTHHTGKLSFSTVNSCSNLNSMWGCQNRCSCEDCIVYDNQLKATILNYFTEKIQSSFHCDLSQMMTDISISVIAWLQLHAVKPGTTLAEQQWGKKPKERTDTRRDAGFISLSAAVGDENTIIPTPQWYK